ncbi:lysine N(6)-hydroxylase/L-ornithine N(5)-oxygenase family protein [Phaeobacter sp. HF9A]|uniref:lysine N(6)-hydroxylase/L-ornithine N(5)-oxygenase family protein n=1 Tax=Phaeobacter sp. HF9A TaxID=2721561 RepID=UPI00142FE65E|nr:lysine N(6)-hydroxylase/L-ornithine N(5)-oxygenase family protein [Phaeobacter sp. HF9A]NIZ12303.1 lysine N(6)-hydroxylase/L-ornithine N(5)-oxygenase family protein [Phaeobacter sp. HF9A]
MTNPQHIHDVTGVGFGPSNLALAIALQERAQRGARTLDAIFLEAKPAFAWHPDMLLENSDMQVSFIKDLVTLRNPASRFSFLSYLSAKGRLERFVNRKSFFPSRHEFNDYFAWAAAQMEGICTYDQRVVGAEPVRGPDGSVDLLAVISQDSSGAQTRRLTRDLVLAIGGKPSVPEVFAEVQHLLEVVHSSAYLSTVKPRLAAAKRPLKVAVIGSGQSGAEIFYDLANDPTRPEVDFIFRSHALKPSDDSPFVNEIFNADFTSYVYRQPAPQRRALMEEYANTNYSVVDGDLIAQIYGLFYEQDVTGGDAYGLLRSTRVSAAEASDGKIRLMLCPADGGGPESRDYDLVVLATGYQRRLGETLLAGLHDHITGAETGRTYQIGTAEGFSPRIFLQGYCEDTHGLSDTLLSVLAVRVDEIAGELLCPRPDRSAQLTAAE